MPLQVSNRQNNVINLDYVFLISNFRSFVSYNKFVVNVIIIWQQHAFDVTLTYKKKFTYASRKSRNCLWYVYDCRL